MFQAISFALILGTFPADRDPELKGVDKMNFRYLLLHSKSAQNKVA